MAVTDISPAESFPRLDFVRVGEVPLGINIEPELERAMSDEGGTLQYWDPDAQVGTTKGFSREYFQKKFDATVGILKTVRDDVADEDIQRTQLFIDEIFGVYDGSRPPYRYGGSSAFVAASRVQRHGAETDNFAACDYRRETVGCLPILKYVDEASAQRVMVGMPPFVLDYYGEDNQGGGGVMIFAPLSLDLIPDSGDKALDIGLAVAQETSWFAKERLGVKLMSLAALLPKVTGYGALFEYPGIETTTGHGGTTWLISEVIEKAIQDGRVDPRRAEKIGVLGVGGIGLATADYLLGKNADLQIAINDHNPKRQQEVGAMLRDKYGAKRVLDIPDVAEILQYGGVTASAITQPIDLRTLNLAPGSLEGSVYVDDSQPAAVAAEQVIALGGLHVGVIGSDHSTSRAVGAQRFNYGGLGPRVELRDVTTGTITRPGEAYGCAMEGVAKYYAGDKKDLIKDAVTGDDVRTAAAECEAMGFVPAALQTLYDGETIEV